MSFEHASAVSALSAQVTRALREHYAVHGHYPRALTDLKLELSAADGAAAATLGFVRYSSNGESFTYAEVGPDEWHRRVWWCYGREHCGAANLE